jgi:hypothetical protein
MVFVADEKCLQNICQETRREKIVWEAHVDGVEMGLGV